MSLELHTKQLDTQPMTADEAMLSYVKRRMKAHHWVEVGAVGRRARPFLGRIGVVDRSKLISVYTSAGWHDEHGGYPPLLKGNAAALSLLDDNMGLDGNVVTDVEEYAERHAHSMIAWGHGGGCEVLIRHDFARGALSKAWDEMLMRTSLGGRNRTAALLISHTNAGVDLLEDDSMRELVKEFARPGIDPLELTLPGSLKEVAAARLPEGSGESDD